MKTMYKTLFTLGPLLLLAAFSTRPLVLHHYEPKFLTTGPNGPETPQTVGIPYERVRIASNDRVLDGYLVQAPPACRSRVAVLIFHGVMETISQWVKTQRLLYDHCVSSLVFDYSGHGNSSRPGTVKNVDQDAIAAYSYFASRFGEQSRLCVVGHSMGNGIMLDSFPNFHPKPACAVVASAFTSLRDAGARRGTSRLVLYMVPDVWNNVENISKIETPLLVIHSDADGVNPVDMGQQVFRAAHDPKQMLVLRSAKHNDICHNPTEAWWGPVLEFVSGENTLAPPVQH